MGAILSTIGKKITSGLLFDPETIFKKIFKIILIPILILILLIGLPIYIIFNIPSLLFESSLDNDMNQKQLEITYLYYDAPVEIDKSNLDWIEQMKKEYSWCDDIVVNHNFNLTWQQLMSIDAVIYEQDFSNTNKNNIHELGYKFMNRKHTTKTYEVEEEYEYEEIYQVIIRDENGQPKRNNEGEIIKETRSRIVTKTRTVTKTRAILTIETKTFDTVLNQLGFDIEQKELANNIYNTILNIDVEGNFNLYDDIKLGDLSEYPEGTANLPYYNQTDKRWGANSYGSSTIASGGCGPTSLAMVVAGLTNNKVTPLEVANWSYANGHRAEGKGSYWSLMTAGGRHYGLNVEAVSRKNPERIVQALSQGHPIIASMGRGHFTKTGHFIVLRGLTSDGKILVHDPSSVSRSKKAWDLHIIMGESSMNGGENGSPFWIYKR